jgi:hypothetical protein
MTKPGSGHTLETIASAVIGEDQAPYGAIFFAMMVDSDQVV